MISSCAHGHSLGLTLGLSDAHATRHRPSMSLHSGDVPRLMCLRFKLFPGVCGSVSAFPCLPFSLLCLSASPPLRLSSSLPHCLSPSLPLCPVSSSLNLLSISRMSPFSPLCSLLSRYPLFANLVNTSVSFFLHLVLLSIPSLSFWILNEL